MIQRIVLENFMSHRRTVIEPAPGLTLLVGPNNCGKSAVVTALQVLMKNEHAERFVRHGAKSASILVEVSEGGKIEWRRDGRTVSYRVNGREVHRLKGGVPEDLDSVLKMKPVAIANSDGEFQVHVAEQKRPIFLIDEPAGRAATFFASASDTRLLLQMQHLLKERRKDRKREADQLETTIEANRARLERVEPILGILRRIDAAESTYAEVMGELAAIQAVERTISELGSAEKKCQGLRSDAAALQPLIDPPSLEDTSALRRTCEAVDRSSSQIRDLKVRQTLLERLVDAPEMEPTEALADLAERLVTAADRCRALERQVDALGHLRAAPALEAVEDLAHWIRSAESLGCRIRVLENKHRMYEAIALVPELEDVQELRRCVQALESGLAQTSRARAALESASNDLKEARSALEVYIAQHPECPVCGSRLTPEKVVQGVNDA